MTLKQGRQALSTVLLTFFLLFTQQAVAAQATNVSTDTVQRLENLINAQQKQLEFLQQQLDQLKTASVQAEPAPDKDAQAVAMIPKVITSGQERVKLSISGQVNRMINVMDDGKDTDAYFVDNDNSNTRVRMIGTAKINEDMTIGSKIEMSLSANKSGKVSQDDKDTDDIFDLRWADLTLESKKFGKLWLGKGDSASNSTAEVDLSRTSIIGYSSISDTAGGFLFRESDGDQALTDITVGNAFNNMDGLSRQNRIRYDTPVFMGFRMATSVSNDSKYDGAIFWGGQGYGFKAGAAAAVADPNEDETGLKYDGSFSVLHEQTGLNLTLSAGLIERDNQDDANNFYAKAGWLTNFFKAGDTAFSVDYTKSENLTGPDDEGTSMAVSMVQHFDEYGTEVYLQYRIYSLDRDYAPDVDDIKAGTIGARVKF